MPEATFRQDKNTVKELTELNEELENYFRSTIIPQLFFDRDLILRKYSPAALRQFNLKSEDIGKHIHALSNNLRYSTLEEDINITMESGEIIEKEIQTTDEKWYRMNVLPYVQRKDNRTNGVIITFIDINNYVLALKELQKVNSEHELFIYSVSHDLKGPVNNIEGLIEYLIEAIKNDNTQERDRILGMIKKSSHKLMEMIRELGEVSKAQAENQDNKVKIKFEDILDEVNLTLKEKIEEAHAQINLDFLVDEINFPRKNLRSIFYNLISNAVKYRSDERDPVIWIKTKKQGDFIILSVKDNGRGIEEDKKEAIFSQFTRVLQNVEGTGIGLYLVSRIVNEQGGKIIVHSKVNEGSEFQLYLKA